MRVVQAFGAGGRFVLRGRWRGVVGAPSPQAAGAALTVVTGPGGGPTTLPLPAGGWRAGRAYRYAEDAGGERVRAALRLTRRGGRFLLAVRGRAAPLVPPGSEEVSVRLVVGDVRWCGDVREDMRENARRLHGRSSVALAACPCEPLPADTFAAIERRIFGRHTCTATGCHGTAPGQAGLLLAGGAAYAKLVGIPSLADPALLRVAPGDPEASMLWRKLAARTTGSPAVPGRAMPIGDPALGAAELEAVRQWILAGAPATGTVAAAQALLDCTLP